MPSPAPCPTPIGCPNPEPCSEVLDSQCVIYTGAEIKCDTRNTIVATNDNIAEALQNIVDYFCTEVTISSDITCGEDLVVEADTTVTNAIINVVEYFCDEVSQIIPITSFRAVTDLPQNINALAPTLANAFIGNGDTITNLTVGYQLVDNVTTTQYAPVTGQWTCPQTGKYDINYNIYLSAPASVTGPGQFGWGQNGGSIQIGATTTNGLNTYAADIISLPLGVPFLRVYATGVLQGVQLNAGTVLVLKVLNLSGINYTSVSGDNIDWSIRRVG
jgi:hypothetical protein